MDASAMNDEDLSNLSDEDLMKMSSPPEVTLEEPELTGSAKEEDTPLETDEDPNAGEVPHEDSTQDPEPAAQAEGDGSGDDAQKPDGSGDDPEVKPETGDTKDPEDVNKTPETGETETDYENLYKQVMAPFRANGREFAPSSPEEAVQLMQMGANYTKKMQALQPKMKLIRMLEKNELLDEDKISFLIDVSKKNPDAVAKLVKDSEIDPMDIDTSEDKAYTPGNYRVSDDEMAFSDTLSGVMSTPTGKETVQVINSTWDAQSKDAVYKEPAILTLIDEHRGNGLYARISAEIDRQQILGRLTNIPFIEAYKQAGTELQQAGLLSPTGSSQQTAVNTDPVQAAKVTGRRDASPSRQKSSVQNGAAARRVSPAPSTGKTPAKKAIDPFDLTDEQIMAMNSLKV